MVGRSETERVETVVVGGGQAVSRSDASLRSEGSGS